jgi:hypothetical protein
MTFDINDTLTFEDNLAEFVKSLECDDPELAARRACSWPGLSTRAKLGSDQAVRRRLARPYIAEDSSGRVRTQSVGSIEGSACACPLTTMTHDASDAFFHMTLYAPARV